MLKKSTHILLIGVMMLQVVMMPVVVIADDVHEQHDQSLYLAKETDALYEQGDFFDDEFDDEVVAEYIDESVLVEELHLLTEALSEPVGMQGFLGDDALGDDPNEVVEVIVQFMTPPQVALELTEELAQGRPIGTRQAREGRRRRGNRNRFRDEALNGHEIFNEQLNTRRTRMRTTSGTEIEVVATYHELFNGQLLRVPTYLVDEIANLPEVYAVFPHVAVSPIDPIEMNGIDSFSSNSHFMQATRDYLNLDEINANMGITGNGVRVAVIDSGIYHGHSQFASFLDETGRVRGWQRYDNTASTNPAHSVRAHGTEVSGVVVAVSPNIELWHYRVDFSDGAGGMNPISAITAAYQDGMDVINISFGAGFGTPFNPLDAVVNLAVLDGVVVVAASGNAGEGGLDSPASASLAITVGAGHSGGWSSDWGDTLRPYSSIGPVPITEHIKPDIIAPSGLNTPTIDGGYRTADGTSFSAPVISGLVALLIEAFPDASTGEIKARIMNTARPLTDLTPNHVFHVGAGFVQPINALTNETIVTVEHDVPLTEDASTPFSRKMMSSLSFGRLGTNQAVTMPITITNRGQTTKNYTISYVVNGHIEVTPLSLSDDQISVVANGTSSLLATMRFPATAPAGLYEGYIYVREGNSVVARLPFAATHIPSELPTYHVTVQGGIGSGSFEVGTIVTITADEPAQGYEFSHWTSDDQVVFADAFLSTTTLIMPDSDVTVSAIFEPTSILEPDPEPMPDPIPVRHTITFNWSLEGVPLLTVELVSGTTIGEANLNLSPPEREGYHFVGWQVNPLLTSEELLAFVITEDLDFVAVWEANEALEVVSEQRATRNNSSNHRGGNRLPQTGTNMDSLSFFGGSVLAIIGLVTAFKKKRNQN